jgi:hypothetical protein
MRTLKGLTILLIVTIGISGCSLFKDRVREPLCLPARPVLDDISREEQIEMWSVNRDVWTKVAINDTRLKTHISTIEEITEAHNGQFKATCAE